MVSGYAIATLILFVFSIFCVIRPVSIPTPRPLPKISLNLSTAPIITILILWAAQCLDPTVIRNGIVGTEGVQPYNILILFISLAYMAITLDISGALRAAAYWVSGKGGNNGWKLYLYFYILLSVVGILLGNDPIILSGTPFLVYYTQVADLDPLAWVMAEFAAANTASMVLFVGNITNVVICEGFDINNAEYTAYTILPFVACSIFCFVALALQYRKQIPRRLTRATHLDPWKALRDPVAACVGSFMLGATLILCLVVSFFGVDVWMISLPFAVCKFLFDLGWDSYRLARNIPIGLPEVVEEAEEEFHGASAPEKAEQSGPVSPTDLEDPSASVPTSESTAVDSKFGTSKMELNADPMADSHIDSVPEAETKDDVGGAQKRFRRLDSQRTDREPTPKSNPLLHSPPVTDTKLLPFFRRCRSYMDDFQARLFKRFPTVMTALPRLPIGLVPYSFSQFILIEALNHQGWVNIFGDWLVRASHKQVHPTIWLIGVLGVILCNISGTNIGATILLTQVVRAAALPYDASRAAAIALAVASNVGAVSFTFSASLAGLLWQSIMKQKGIRVKQTTFAFWNLLPILALTTVGLGVVSAEMAVLFSS